jgi:two-component system, NarL family, sensor histidine kinase UhpB
MFPQDTTPLLLLLLAASIALAGTAAVALVQWRRAKALARSDRQLRQILAKLPLGLFLKDADSRFVMMNAACEQAFGRDYATLAGTHGGEHYPAEQQAGFLAADRGAFASGRLWTDEEWVWHAGQQQDRRLQTYKQPLYDDDGKPALLVGMCIDVTERRAAEEALQSTLRQLRELSDQQETAREHERRRLAQCLHDELGQNLMALKLDATLLSSSAQARHPRLHGHSERVLATLDGAIGTVRALINELHPSTLELGLPAATDWLLKQQARRSGMQCRLHLVRDSAGAALTAPQTWAVFRMIQEALFCIEAYASATRLDVSLDLDGGALLIVISDNGLGIGLQAAGERHGSLAMLALRERVSAYGGQLSEDNRPGRGTTLTILLPDHEKREAAASRQDQSVRA